jgi:glucuronate isomerase
MKRFIGSDFLLETRAAIKLYHNYAEAMPIIDYHCHINPEEIAGDKKYENITQIWLNCDHYKWRAMRSSGVKERYITGDASDYEKFEKWAETLPRLIGNPLYHWTHLELKRYFEYDGILNKKTAKHVWDLCNEKLKRMSVRDIIKKSNVEVICTTDDPTDSLEFHKQIAKDNSFSVRVLPAFRPDRAINIDKDDYKEYLMKLEAVSGIKINSFDALKKALEGRIEYFDGYGCKVSDHAFEYIVCSIASDEEVERIFEKKSGELTGDEIEKYKTAVTVFLAKEYEKHNWVMQIHYGAIRDVNTKMFKILGPDTGYDCISTRDSAAGLAGLLDELEKDSSLPKTIIYSLNPNDDAMICSTIGCFQGEGIKSKVQHGSAWWFNDSKVGMIRQIKNLANISVLGNFIGMLTDSRSFLSYARHEYFRRVLCNLIGEMVEKGEYPDGKEQLRTIVEDICYKNAKSYFEFEIPEKASEDICCKNAKSYIEFEKSEKVSEDLRTRA